MPKNAVILDVSRTRLQEPVFSASRIASQIQPPQTGQNTVFFWPGTQTWTLQPINVTPAFYETPSWEALKCRLSDTVNAPDFVTEVPHNRQLQSDYFIAGIVKNTNLPAGYAGSSYAGGGLFQLISVPATLPATAPTPTLNTNPGVVFLQSSQSYPVNQGYCLRFRIDGTGVELASMILEFYFGDFMVRLNSDGLAEFYQNPPGSTFYVYLSNFLWSHTSEVHDHFHRIIIFPHCRNCIEFLTRTGGNYRTPFSSRRGGASQGHFTFRLPGELVKGSDGIYQITQAGNWTVRVNENYRPLVQVSRLGFFNGKTNPALLQDSGIDVYTGLSGQVNLVADADLNGGQINTSLLEETTGKPFVSNSAALKPQAQFAFVGIGDVPGPGLASTRTPELYGYMMDKPALFRTDDRSALTRQVNFKSLTIDQGSKPDEERATLKIDNSQTMGSEFKKGLFPAGQVETYCRRADIPLQVVSLPLVGDGAANPLSASHAVSGQSLTLFEGTSTKVESGESPGTEARAITLQCLGMGDALTLHEWFGRSIPDFGADPNANGKTWFWTDAVRRCFEAAGFAPEDVVIEEESKWKIRLWLHDTGGTKGGGSSTGHVDGSSTIGTAWRPSEGTAIVETIKMFLHDCLGWEWHWNRKDHKWHIYKRPDPSNPYDAAKLVPKVDFFSHPSDLAAARKSGVRPAYDIEDFSTSNERPTASVLELISLVNEASPLTREQYYADLRAIGASIIGSNADPGLLREDRLLTVLVSNPRAVNYTPGFEQDFIGVRFREVPMLPGLGREGMKFIAKTAFRNYCFGQTFGTFRSDWGDANTAFLRKYDVVNLKYGALSAPEKWFIYRIEPDFSSDRNMRARYQVVKLRNDTPPPR